MLRYTRYFSIIRLAIRERMRYRFDFFMTFVATIMFSFLYYMLWKAIYANTTDPIQPWSQLITYIMVGQAINFARWSPADRAIVYGTASRIRSGDISMDLIRPIGFQTRRFLETAGNFLVEMLWINLPCLVLFIIFLGIDTPKDLTTVLGFLISLVTALIVSYGINSIVMMISFWTTNAQGAQIAKKAIIDLLAGTLIPFEFFPGWLQSIVLHLPFQGMAYIPLSIYTGKLAGANMAQALVEQLGWALIMLLVSRLLWWKASKQITVYGG